MAKKLKPVLMVLSIFIYFVFLNKTVVANEVDLKIPDLHAVNLLNGFISGYNLLLYGSLVIIGTLGISLYLRRRIMELPAHKSMLDVSGVINQTCHVYLKKQIKFIRTLFGFVAAIIVIYLAMPFVMLCLLGIISSGQEILALALTVTSTVIKVLFFSVVGVCGSYFVALYGIRLNMYANSRTAFAALRKNPWNVVNIPLQAGVSIGLFLISLELIMMIIILLFVPREITGYCFLGFAVGESLSAFALRISGGIFTKIADIGSDLMKVFYKIKEDDPRNAGVIADCTGDNAGDSIGPTADFFESYGVTGVALISFIVLAVTDVSLQAQLIVWIFSMRFIMDIFSGIAYFINQSISVRKYKHKTDFDFEEVLTRLTRIAAVSCITISYVVSYFLISDISANLWWQLASIISCGILAALLIPEFTKKFTSAKSDHVQEIVQSSREGGASLTILSGIVAGNFSAYWESMLLAFIMLLAYVISCLPGMELINHASIFAFGLVAFGLLCMGPVSIAVDSYGPVSDNAQSIWEMSQIENLPNIQAEIERDFGFTPNFTRAKYFLEKNDAVGNTFKATVKPVLTSTGVTGATTMIFSIIMLLEATGMLNLNLTHPPFLIGLIVGGGVVYWFSGATIQAVVTGAYRAIEFIKHNIKLDENKASIEDSKKVVEICTGFAQKGAWNIFFALMCSTLAFALFDPNFFIGYLIGFAIFGFPQATYMANAGGAMDNAKKLVESNPQDKSNIPLYNAVVIGDTVGDPFKDTSSVSLNPATKFITLFGLLCVEIAIKLAENFSAPGGKISYGIIHYLTGTVFLIIFLIFAWRSFSKMRIKA